MPHPNIAGMASAGRRAFHGWRAKIGLVRPTHQGKSAQFWFDNAPEGVEIMDASIGYRDTRQREFESGFERVAAVAETLVRAGAAIVVMGGTPPALLAGPQAERRWADELAERLGVPVVPPMYPHICALQALGARQITAATYYRSELNAKMRAYFAEFGMSAHLRDDAAMLAEGEEETGGLQQLGHLQIQQVTFDAVYRYCKHLVTVDPEPTDAVYINGGGWDAAPAIPYLEYDLERPVVWAQAAVLWYTYRLLKVRCPIDRFGTLLSQWPSLPPGAG